MSRSTPPVVFIHGFKGAHLEHDDSGKRHWLTGPQALGWRGPGVSMPLNWRQGRQSRDRLVPVEPVGKVLHVPFYRPLMLWCAQRTKAFYPFVYDWRRDNTEAVDAFGQFLRSVSGRHGGQPVQIIAHSNGGLITYAAMVDQPELVHSIVFAATPFGGGIGRLEDLQLGLKTGWNRSITSPEVMQSFVTTFAFFPLPNESSQVFAENGQTLPLDWYDLAAWQEHRLGPLRPGATVGPADIEHLRNVLRVTKAFRERLASPVSSCPPIAIIASDSTPTLAAVRREPGAALGWNFDVCEREPGDGCVRFSSCLPPEGMTFKLYKTLHQHSQVLSDVDTLGCALDDLCAS